MTDEPFYLQAASWSPDDSTIYIATTGYHPNGFPTGSYPRTGLCDVAAAFPATINPPQQPNGQPGYVLHNWVNYIGCDSLYSTAADASTAYFGGHERWASNPNGCDFAGPGAISAPGMVGALTGQRQRHVQPNPRPWPRRRRHADHRRRAVDRQRQHGQHQACGGKSGHAGICLLPY